jgi:hypothetical protein
MGIYMHNTIIIFHKVGSRLVALPKFIYASSLVYNIFARNGCFKRINVVFQMFTSSILNFLLALCLTLPFYLHFLFSLT